MEQKKKEAKEVSKKSTALFPRDAKDAALKKVLECKEIFAAMVNAILFNSRHVVKADELEYYVEETHVATKFGTKKLIRDCSMLWKVAGISFSFEIQSKKEEETIGRVLMYDGADICSQIRRMPKEQKAKGDIKILPSITIVFYTGQQEWNMITNIKDLYNFDSFPEYMRDKIKGLFGKRDYNVFFCSLRDLELSDLDKFEGDAKLVINFLMYYAKNYGKTVPLHRLDQSFGRPRIVLELFDAFSQNTSWTETFDRLLREGKKEEEITMCNILDNLKWQAENEYKVEIKEKDEALARMATEKDEALAKKDDAIAKLKAENYKALAKKDDVIAERDKYIAKLEKELEELQK